MQTAGAKCALDIAALLRARNPLLLCVSREEARTERVVFDGAASAGYAPVVWDCARGISNMSGEVLNARATDPIEMLNEIRDSEKRQVWILRDLAPWLKDPNVCRAVKSLCRELPQSPRDSARAMVMISSTAEVPAELSGNVITIDVPLPDRAEIATLLDAAVGALPEQMRAAAAPNGVREQAIDAALGLSAEEAQSTFARSLISKQMMDAGIISGEKRRVISRERVLEWFDPVAGGLDAIGGLENLKGWLIQRRQAFSAKARAYGLPAPKGLLAVGVPGCGKSLTAKALAAAWSVPLLKLDMGALKSKFVGDSEANFRKALKVAETVAPCILWIDEVEKALAGANDGGQDGGVSKDQLGVILSWMQDHTAPVFVVATANDATVLKPEFIRRFDGMFFVDLPTASERAEILQTALRANGRADAPIDYAAVVAASSDFTGAEMAQLVIDAMYAGFADDAREICTNDLLAAAKQTVPLARTASDKIAALRQWAQGRARPASVAEVKSAPASAARSLDI
jgi:AAA+ superfamily predicted ATPase